MNILLVDDESHILEVIGDFLRDCGHNSVNACDGFGALNALESQGSIDLVISDIRMPNMDGIEFLKTVRIRYPGTPVILMTGHGDEAVAVLALQQGAFDYLKKPIKLNELLQRVEQVAERNRLESEALSEVQGPLEDQPRQKTMSPSPNSQAKTSSSAILVVEPDQEVAASVGHQLSTLGHTVQVAVSGEQGLEKLKQGRFDIVMVEFDLPDIEGPDMVDQIRGMDPTTIPIVITTREDQETAVAALNSGARGLLTKPILDTDTVRGIDQALSERKRLVDPRLLLGDLIEVRSELREKVLEKERFLEHLIDSAPFGILSTDQNGRILTFNGKAERMYGYAQSEALGQDLHDLTGGNEDEAPIDIRESIKAIHTKKNGEPLPVLLHPQDILDDRKQEIGKLFVIEDLTEREQMESQLVYAERLSLLGQLAPRIAHEFKSPLQVISGLTEIALLELDSGHIDGLDQILEKILPATTQLTDLVQQLLNLGKPTKQEQAALNLEFELERVLDNLTPLGVVKYCQVSRDFEKSLPSIYGDRAQIEQLLRNLIVNAAQAMEKRENHELYLSLKKTGCGDGIVLEMRDTGPGIEPDHLGRIFEPFFTTKPEGKGTGLGLPIVKTILDRHNATIEVESEVGKGTQFQIRFPVYGGDENGSSTFAEKDRAPQSKVVN
jgi:PAS domain S-box-containing protein